MDRGLSTKSVHKFTLELEDTYLLIVWKPQTWQNVEVKNNSDNYDLLGNDYNNYDYHSFH